MRSIESFPVLMSKVVLAVLPFSLAGEAAVLASDHQALQVTIEKDVSTLNTSISVLNSLNSGILVSSCSRQLSIPSWNFSMTANIDNQGLGTLTMNAIRYTIHENSIMSGGISCSRMYNDEEAVVLCAIPSSIVNLPAITSNDSLDHQTTVCSNTGKRRTIETRSLKNHAMAMISGQVIEPQEQESETKAYGGLVPAKKRQGGGNPCGTWTTTTKPVENPDPHQNYYLKQLSVSSTLAQIHLPPTPKKSPQPT